MPESIRGFKVTDIVDRLALDMLRLLKDILSAPHFEQDRLYLGLLLTISRKTYVNKLLYRDYSADKETQWYSLPMPDGSDAKVHEQSVAYLQHVLSRKPKLARRLQHEPGNMHLLLGAFCRFGTSDKTWADAEVRRDQELELFDQAPDFYTPLGRTLAALCKSLGTDYSPESTRRREQYGPLWLIRDVCTAEVPEELSLFDVVEGLPLPLDSNFTSDPELQRLVVRVMDALNERYMLLRGCGLNPAYWHDRDEPSIARLRDMKRLRQAADELLRLGIEESNIQAYRRTFNDLKGSAKTFAGFASFDDFASDETGMSMLRYTTMSLDDSMGDDGEGDGWLRHEAIADPDAEDIEESFSMREAGSQWIHDLIDDQPSMFNPMMQYFFEQVIGEGRPIYPGPGDDGVLADAAFRQLLDDDPECEGLDDYDRADLLCKRAEILIKRGLKKQQPVTA
ncbi:MAG: hypothetical protein ACR2Q4_11330 [Geminicoccaceae bacterium]